MTSDNFSDFKVRKFPIFVKELKTKSVKNSRVIQEFGSNFSLRQQKKCFLMPSVEQFWVGFLFASSAHFVTGSRRPYKKTGWVENRDRWHDTL